MVEAAEVGILTLLDNAQLIDFIKRKNAKNTEFAQVRYIAGTWRPPLSALGVKPLSSAIIA